MKDIVIIANYIHFKNEKGNSRFLYLADKLRNKEKVQVITSTFYHRTKKQRKFKSDEIKDYDVKLIYEPGYKKNISLKRLYSNYIFARNLIKYLKIRKRPDIIYLAVPPTIVGKKIAKFAKKNSIRFIIDIQDLWPEAYKMIIKIPIISDILFFPIKKQAEYIYKNANDIVAVSKTYLQRASKVNKIAKNKISVFLGTDLNEFDKYKNSNKNQEKTNETKIVYVGTLGNSYNIKYVIDAIKKLNNKNVKLVVIGGGELEEEFKQYAKNREINYEFNGYLDYPQMIEKLCECDIAVNPIQSKSASSIINKVGDYAAAGLPVINTQNSKEYKELIEKYKIGYNCSNEDIDDMVNKIEYLINNEEERKNMGRNNRKLAEDKFDRNKTYNKIVKLIENK